ncbi:MAG: SDR family oxidoreductase [Oscillospiraceae bacterium]|nr:SDR family oxidoreductase [Oscillospiraceae bacterium]
MDYQKLLLGKQALLVNCEEETEKALENLFLSHGAQVRRIHMPEELAEKESADILVCGMIRPEGAIFHEQHRDAVCREAFRNLQLLEAAVHSVIGYMMEHCDGKIVAVVSEYGDYSVPMRSMESCTAMAMTGLVRGLAMDYCKYNIRANCVLLPFQTGFIGQRQMRQQNIMAEEAKDLQLLRRLPEPEDIAQAVLFLASDMSGFISGETIPVNGGGFNIGHNQSWDHWLNHVI